MFEEEFIVESKESNQGLLDAVRNLEPEEGDMYFIAFDIVYDNMDVVNKLLELQEAIKKYPEQIQLLDVTCFEHIILSFRKLIEWTGTGRKDKIAMREHILQALEDHRINLDTIQDTKTLNYLKGFKRFSTERVLKSITYELTDGDAWSVKGELMGECWYKDCCVLSESNKSHCNTDLKIGESKIFALLQDTEMQRIVSKM